jgi:hypothetical protein
MVRFSEITSPGHTYSKAKKQQGQRVPLLLLFVEFFVVPARLLCALLILFVTTSGICDESDSASKPDENKAPNVVKTEAKPAPVRTIDRDALFQDIMNSLSVKDRLRIDSLKAVRSKEIQKSKPDASIIEKADFHADKPFLKTDESSKQQRLDLLPDEVRRRVEKAMHEIEQKRKDRGITFKERQNK